MTARTCPDWPQLMELAPDLQFKHYSVAEARLPADALSSFPEGLLGELEPVGPGQRIGDGRLGVLRDEDVVVEVAADRELAEWTTSGPGTATALG